MSRTTQMTVAECRDLLADAVVGRVAIATPVGPRIVPVSYSLHGDAIAFRTPPGSELSTYGSETLLAFEVDDLEHLVPLQGWTVVAVGPAHVVIDAEEIVQIRESWNPRSWATGTRNVYVELVWRALTGQRRVASAE